MDPTEASVLVDEVSPDVNPRGPIQEKCESESPDPTVFYGGVAHALEVGHLGAFVEGPAVGHWAADEAGNTEQAKRGGGIEKPAGCFARVLLACFRRYARRPAA